MKASAPLPAVPILRRRCQLSIYLGLAEQSLRNTNSGQNLSFGHPNPIRSRIATAQHYTRRLALPFLPSPRPPSAPNLIPARSRYLVAISGCNDCHTPGYAQQGERIPEAERLTGMGSASSGPWGVSYPANLRLGASPARRGDWMAMWPGLDGLRPCPGRPCRP